MGLTNKILLFTSLIVVALAASTLVFTTVEADRLAGAAVREGLAETREVWTTYQADRYSKLRLGLRVLANDPYFKAAVETGDEATVLDMLKERGQDLAAGFFIATDPAGLVVARSDRPAARGEDLSADPAVAKSMDGEESATVWRQGERLFHAVSVPMLTGPKFFGVLVAGFAIDESLAAQIRKLTHSEIAFVTRAQEGPRLSVSSLGPREAALAEALPRLSLDGSKAAAPFTVDLQGELYQGVAVDLTSAGGETLGSVLALRSHAVEMAAYRQFRRSLILVSLAVMAAALVLAYVAASRIAGPVTRLVELVERARDGSYTGAVSADTHDEIGVLARAFNNLLADLREKEQMIGFLREGLTPMGRGAGSGVTQADRETTISTSAVISAQVARGTVFADRYEIQGTLGKGGMGVVYRARDRQLDETVALKVLRPEVLREDTTLLDRFKQEIKLARRITHRNVLRTHDFGEAGGVFYISMEYLEGVTLKELIRTKGALPLGVGLRIAKQICHGLEAAHNVGVVHRDIKPQNMLILPESGELKVMDFGIARVSEMRERGMTSTGVIMGTPDYMPPEQAQAAPTDFRSDIYSLGVVFFEMFVGRLPFQGDNAMGILLQHIQAAPPAPRSLNPRLPAQLETLILRCLEKSPARRYARMADLIAALSDCSASLDPEAA
jgi:eukaryotic-like serine/threonine-protein kinase